MWLCSGLRGCPRNPVILEPAPPQRIVLIPPVEDGGSAHQPLHGAEVGLAKRLPFGNQRHGVGVFDCLVSVRHDLRRSFGEPLLRNALTGRGDGNRVVGLDLASPPGRRHGSAPVTGPRPCRRCGLECQAPDVDGLSCQIRAELRKDILREDVHLGFVAGFYGFEQA